MTRTADTRIDRQANRQAAGSSPWYDRAALGIARAAARRMLRVMGDPPLSIVLWSGEEIGAGPAAAVRVILRDAPTFWRLMTNPLFQFGEAYAAGRLELDGELQDFLGMVYERCQHFTMRRGASAWAPAGLQRWRRNTLIRSREHIHHHYDLGNDFYRLWLDEQLVYTCAYFSEPSLTLEEAQWAKMEHVCRKLRLRPGQTVLEAGCGWGALAMHMARHHRVQVKACNISHEQILHAREQARQQGLDGQVEFIEDDWRNLQGRYDAFVSVGMLEHAGLENYRLLGQVIQRCLKPEGLGLIHTIGLNWPNRLNPWIERRIFPGAQPPTLRQMMDIFEPHAFSVLDVENLRLHYAITLHHWLDRFERAVDTVRQMFDERFVRTWRLYLAGSIAAFEHGAMQLFQVVFTRQQNNQIPWTRAELYTRSHRHADV